MAVPTDSGAAQWTQRLLFDPMSPRSAGSAAFDELWEHPGRRVHFIQSEILEDALWLLMDSRIRLESALELALRHIELVHASNGRTETKYRKETRKFFTLAQLHGVQYLDEIEPTLVEDYLWEASRHRGAVVDVRSTTASNRQSILRLVFDHLRELGLWTGRDPLGAPVKRARGEASRPMTDEEQHRIRMFAENGLFITGRSVLLALAEAGASAEEIARVTPIDVDLASAHVLIRGRAERTNPMTEWGVSRLTSYLERVSPDGNRPLTTDPVLPIDRAAHSVAVRLRKLIVDAGLGGRPGLTARSIRLGVARSVLEAEGLEAAARFLGDASLDATAGSLRYRWWER